jgi:acyl carrier protein
MNLFAKAVAEVLEVDTVALDDDFRAFGGWCSLQGFGLLVMMENDFHAPVNVERFLELRTVRDLYREAFIALAAEVFGVGRQVLSGETKRGEIPQWDSVNHLRLVMEAEKRFETSYSLEIIPGLAKLDDFLID